MIHKLYGIYDVKAKSLVNTFMSLSDASAVRSFEQVLTTPEDTIMTAHPEDFAVVKICDIDDQSLSPALIYGNEYSSDLLKQRRIQAIEYRAEREAAYQAKLEWCQAALLYYDKKETTENEN